MENNHTSHTSVTQCPVNFEKCSACDGQLPPGIPRMFTVEIPASGPHKSTFRHLECQAGNNPGPAPERAPKAHVIEMAGLVFGLLTVIKSAPTMPGQTGRRWLCRCECGKEVVVNGGALRHGDTRSCGHARVQLIAETRRRRIPAFARREGVA